MFVLKSKYEELKDKLERKENVVYKLERYNQDNTCVLNDLIKSNYCEESREISDTTTCGERKYLIGKYKLVITYYRLTSDIMELFEGDIRIFKLYTPRESIVAIIARLDERIEELKKLETDINILDKRKKK